MVLAFLGIIGGLVCLIFGAEKLVRGTSSIARKMGVSPFVIGVLIIGFGTSSPEILVSVVSALEGNTGLLVGNAYGSSIANLGLVLGFAAIIAPIPVSAKLLKRDLPVAILTVLIAGSQLFDLKITFWEALILLIGFAGFVFMSLKWQGPKVSPESTESEIILLPTGYAIFWMLAGLVLLIGGSKILVWGAVKVAYSLGLGELFVGLTIVAIGTSLPELATSIAAVKKKEHELFLGNIIGSNIFNLLAVMGIGGLIREIRFDSIFVWRDFSLTVFLSVLLFLFCLGKSRKINRFEGGLFLLIYAAYLVYLYLETIQVLP